MECPEALCAGAFRVSGRHCVPHRSGREQPSVEAFFDDALLDPVDRLWWWGWLAAGRVAGRGVDGDGVPVGFCGAGPAGGFFDVVAVLANALHVGDGGGSTAAVGGDVVGVSDGGRRT